MKMKMPGVDLPDDYMLQLVEEEVLKAEDYDRICEMGCDSFYYEDFLWRISSLKPQGPPQDDGRSGDRFWEFLGRVHQTRDETVLHGLCAASFLHVVAHAVHGAIHSGSVLQSGAGGESPEEDDGGDH